MQLDIVAEGLGFPEGPIAMADGSVVLVEIKRQTLSRCWNGKTNDLVFDRAGGMWFTDFGKETARTRNAYPPAASNRSRRSMPIAQPMPSG